MTTTTSAEMLDAIVKLLTRIPKSTLKVNFARQAAIAGDKSVAADFKTFYTEYKDVFVPVLTEAMREDVDSVDHDHRRILLQLGMVSKLIGTIANDDEYSLLAGCVVFVATWTQQLSKALFPQSRPYAMTAVWSVVMDAFSVDYELQGTLSSVLLALEQYVTGEGDDAIVNAYPPIFPGPAPVYPLPTDIGTDIGAYGSWHKFENATGPLTPEVRASFNRVFGYAADSTKIPSSHVMYINPADDSPAHCVVADSWAIDSMPTSPAEVEYAEEDAEDEAEAAAFKAEQEKLKALSKKEKKEKKTDEVTKQ